MKQIIERVAAVLAGLALVLLFAVIMIEWMVGCGETYIAADGKRHMHECVFLSYGKH